MMIFKGYQQDTSSHTGGKILPLAVTCFLWLSLSSCGQFFQPNSKKTIVTKDGETIELNNATVKHYAEAWTKAKPSIDRLSMMQNDLSLLLAEVKKMPVQNKEIASAAQSVVIQPPAEEIVSTTSDANFALQVASITDMRRLPILWQEMVDKNHALLADMEPNFEPTHLKNTDYYRLKLGRFSTEHEASRKCGALKNAGINCIVVGYTHSDFAQLSDYTAAPLAAHNLLSIQDK